MGPPALRIGHPVKLPSRTGVTAYLFDGGIVRPDLAEHEADRHINLDAYVDLPTRLDTRFDVVMIDGRKRRRCLGVAQNVLAEGGIVLLHDAWRAHYRCGMDAYAVGRRFGDEWWIGSLKPTDFASMLPSHAFERHRESGPSVPIE